jgi:homoserine O-acetyltransferase/O-succinyltransferase
MRLECGVTLSAVDQRITMYGSPRPDGSNIVLVAHALTGSSRVADWWPGVAGEGGLVDPARWCVVGINALGGCYGSTGPASTRDGVAFPRITVRDIVAAARRALECVGIRRFRSVIGGSLGGMQALQWALDEPDRIESAIVIGAHDHHSAMGIALNAVQRDAIALDPVRGLRLARKIAMLTYKSDDLLRRRHDRRPDRRGREYFDVEGYLERQADLIEDRMDPATYVALTHAMDSFDVRGARSTRDGLSPALFFVGISSDWLFRPQDVRDAAHRFVTQGFNAAYLELESDHGHDAFLAESTALRTLLEPILSDDG